MKKTDLIMLPHNERTAITYGLQWLKGNSAPYFSVTATIYEKRPNGRLVEIGGGIASEIIGALVGALFEMVAHIVKGFNHE